MKHISLTLPDARGNPIEIEAPPGVPTGGLSDLEGILGVAFGLIFVLGIVFAIAMIIYSGIQWVTSAGDEKKLQSARSRLIYSIIGLLVVVAAFAIVGVVLNLIGADTGFFLGI